MAQENDQAAGGLGSQIGEQDPMSEAFYKVFASWADLPDRQRIISLLGNVAAGGFDVNKKFRSYYGALPGLQGGGMFFGGGAPYGGGIPVSGEAYAMHGLENAPEHPNRRGLLMAAGYPGSQANDIISSLTRVATSAVEESKAKLQQAEELLELLMKAKCEKDTHAFLETLIAEQVRENKMTPAQQYLAFKAEQRAGNK